MPLTARPSGSGPPSVAQLPPSANVPVYYLGDTSAGIRLFREYHPVPADGTDPVARTRAALQAMDAHLTDRPYFVGERYTIADIALYAYTHVAPEGGFELEPYPAIRTWIQRVMGQPGHVGITA